MGKLEAFAEHSRNVATAAVLFTAAWTDAARKLPEAGQHYGVSDFVIQVFIAVIGALLIVSFDRIVSILIRSSRTLRSVIMGRDDIEGYWIEIMRENSTGKEIGFAVEVISYVSGSFHIDGKQFDLDGTFRGTYWTVMHEYAESNSKLVFGSKHFGDSGCEKAGYSQVHYLRVHKLITGYVGYYTDTDVSGRIDISGQRILTAADKKVAAAILGFDIKTSDRDIAFNLFKRQNRDFHEAATPGQERPSEKKLHALSSDRYDG